MQGVATNRGFLTACLADTVFAAGAATTAFLAEQTGCFASAIADEVLGIAAAVLATAGAPDTVMGMPYAAPIKLAVGENAYELRLFRDPNRHFRVEGLAEPMNIGLRGYAGDLRYAIDGVWRRASVALLGDELHVSTAGGDWIVRDVTWQPAQSSGSDGDGRVQAMTTGTVTVVRAALGDQVRRGDSLLVLEAMKMEHEIRAPVDGVVRALFAAPGKQVARHAVLVEVEPGE